MKKKQILLTNDDGIRSPGLWAAAEALSALGFVTVVAPKEQSSGMGRGMPPASSGIIRAETLRIHGQTWTVYAVDGTPAQSVQHGMFEIMPSPPDLVVSGINYGENLAIGITVSGTVGAAMEAAAQGVPALAVSLETDKEHHFSYSQEVNFSTAAHFTAYFARHLLEQTFPEDVYLLKVDVPRDATPETPWNLTRLSRRRYYQPIFYPRESWEQPKRFDYKEIADISREPEDSDVYVLRAKREVSVTPLSLDFTSRVDFQALERQLSA
jgi:5'-nucleotidase